MLGLNCHVNQPVNLSMRSLEKQSSSFSPRRGKVSGGLGIPCQGQMHTSTMPGYVSGCSSPKRLCIVVACLGSRETAPLSAIHVISYDDLGNIAKVTVYLGRQRFDVHLNWPVYSLSRYSDMLTVFRRWHCDVPLPVISSHCLLFQLFFDRC